MQLLNRNSYSAKNYTPKIIQFGGGNFLRAFSGHQIQQLNKKFAQDIGITIVRSLPKRGNSSLNNQDGLYTLLTQGLDEQNNNVNTHEVIEVVGREISATDEFDEFINLATDVNYETIISNTTEAGIIFDESCKLDDKPASSFPAKVVQLLWQRYMTNGKYAANGFQFLPCELIDKNGDILKETVLKYAELWSLGDDFIKWVHEKNEFYNTLVDRIVPGFPNKDAEEIQARLGYTDNYMIAAEVFSSFLIEKKQGQADVKLLFNLLPEVTITDDISLYKQQKVAILNGAHSALAPLALLHAQRYVCDSMKDENFSRFLNNTIKEEVIPFIQMPEDKAKIYADNVLRRFANPYIQHAWHDISLNSIAKFKVRNLPQFFAYTKEMKKVPQNISLSLAAWCIFYFGDFAHAADFPVRDDNEVIKFFTNLKPLYQEDAKQALHEVLKNQNFWNADLSMYLDDIWQQYHKIKQASLSFS